MATFTFRPIERWPVPFTKTRRRSPFSASYGKTLKDLDREVEHLGVRQAVIQAAVSLSDIRNDGFLYAGARPAHPGIILAFESKKTGPMSMPCDTFIDWQDNLRGISLSLTALRAIDRYGVTQRAEQYRGWSQLPPPGGLATPPPMTVEAAARAVAGMYAPGLADAFQAIMREPLIYRQAYRDAAKRWHPDANGGTQRAEWNTLQQAASVLNQHHGV